MSTQINIKSVLQPGKRAFLITSDSMEGYNRRGNFPLSPYILSYDTYGDGTTQHSSSWVSQWDECTDVCLSIVNAVLEDQTHLQANQESGWRRLLWDICYRWWSDAQLRFALTVQYVEGKTRYYSLEKLAISASQSKQHDRRWTKIESHMDGTPKSARGIIAGGRHQNNLALLMLADELHELSGYSQLWSELEPATEQLHGDWHQAIRALRTLQTALESFDTATKVHKCALQNSLPRKEEVAA